MGLQSSDDPKTGQVSLVRAKQIRAG